MFIAVQHSFLLNYFSQEKTVTDERMLMKTVCLIIMIVGFFVSCCRHDPETEEKILPEATHEGKNTFGCYVDGEVWRLVEMSIYDVLSVSRNYNMQLKMGVSIENGKGEHANLDIFIDSLGSVGI